MTLFAFNTLGPTSASLSGFSNGAFSSSTTAQTRLKGQNGMASFDQTLTSAIQASTNGQSIKNEFLQYARQTPAQRLRTKYLQEHGLTEETLSALPFAQRQQIERAIKIEIQTKMRTRLGETDLLTDRTTAST